VGLGKSVLAVVDPHMAVDVKESQPNLADWRVEATIVGALTG
jgi:hypothetical protein